MSSKARTHKRSLSVRSLITTAIILTVTGYVLFHSIKAFDRTYIEDDWKVTQGIVLSLDAQLKGKRNIERKSEGLEQIVNYEYKYIFI